MSTLTSTIVETALDRLPDHARPEPGEYRGQALVRVVYEYRVGEDFEQRMPVAVPWQKIALAALSRLNTVTVEAIVVEALAGELSGVEKLARRAKAACDRLVEATRRTVRGHVTGTCLIADLQLLGQEVRPEERPEQMAAR